MENISPISLLTSNLKKLNTHRKNISSRKELINSDDSLHLSNSSAYSDNEYNDSSFTEIKDAFPSRSSSTLAMQDVTNLFDSKNSSINSNRNNPRKSVGSTGDDQVFNSIKRDEANKENITLALRPCQRKNVLFEKSSSVKSVKVLKSKSQQKRNSDSLVAEDGCHKGDFSLRKKLKKSIEVNSKCRVANEGFSNLKCPSKKMKFSGDFEMLKANVNNNHSDDALDKITKEQNLQKYTTINSFSVKSKLFEDTETNFEFIDNSCKISQMISNFSVDYKHSNLSNDYTNSSKNTKLIDSSVPTFKEEPLPANKLRSLTIKSASASCDNFHRSHNLEDTNDLMENTENDKNDVVVDALTKALDKSESCCNLIGDFTRPYVLPTVVQQKNQLVAISPYTLVRVLNGEFKEEICEYLIIDCRYPYEYKAGHITGSQNIYSSADISMRFLEPSRPSVIGQVLIFHCEFSSERGPKLIQYLRSQDRNIHLNCYPTLSYPEVYLLNGGYKAFFETFPEYCDPRGYKPMLHADHLHELRHFKVKSRTWPLSGSENCSRKQTNKETRVGSVRVRILDGVEGVRNGRLMIGDLEGLGHSPKS